MTEKITGSCYNHEDPNLWYPEFPEGHVTGKKMDVVMNRIAQAKAICNACPVKDECLEEGMLPKNLGNGIWGGKLPGERIELADMRGIKYSSTDNIKNPLWAGEKRNAMATLERFRLNVA